MTDPAATGRPARVAILGGGVGAMTAAFELTETPDWAERFDITIYQLGWRLGGKGASGRDLDRGARIQEHGLHVWAGYYDNAFRVMRACYEALNRPEQVPIRSVEQAFLGVDQVYLSEFEADHPHFWRVDFPSNDERPGTGGELLGARDYLIELIEGLKELVTRFPLDVSFPGSALLGAVPAELHALLERLLPGERASHAHAAAALARGLPGGGSDTPVHRLLHALLHGLQKRAAEHARQGNLDPPLQAVAAALELGAACAKGMLADRVLTHGFDHIDDLEWTDWVMKHGASRRAMTSSVGRCCYCYVFGSRFGEPTFDNRAVAAGTAMRALLRLLFTYKGSLFFKLQAGMGDIVFAPLYELLSRRGVKFRFFHQVTHLGLSDDGQRIGRIEIAQQVQLKDDRPGAEYQPLVDVGGLPCWPANPCYEQLVDGDTLKARGIDLESAWADWKPAAKLTLREGQDYDLVVLGISLGAFPHIAGELRDHSPAWRDMMDHLKTVSTQAIQLWFKKPLRQLGWPADSGLLTGYYEPIDTWSDMSFLLDREDWGPDGPGQISYLCSVFHPSEPPPPPGPSDYPARQLAVMRDAADAWLNRRFTQLLPHTEGHYGRFDPETLYPCGPGDALDNQFYRINIDPSELYVQSVPGSTRYRLAADQSGFDNLFLAGDWLRTGLNAGCVEAAAMGGLQAARAISGRHVPIVGESDLPASPLAAQNANLPWSLAYARGNIRAAVVTLALPVQAVARLLPSGLSLMAQQTTTPGTHPVGLIFADQSKVRPSFVALGGMSYRECAIAIPFVAVAGDKAPPGPFLFLPALYLDRLVPTLLGRVMYGYRKNLARVSGEPAEQQVLDRASGALALRARLSASARPPGHYYDFPHLAGVHGMMSQPVVAPDRLRGDLFSFLDYGLELAQIVSVSGTVEAGATVLGNEQEQSFPVAGIDSAALGAFEFEGAWTLTNPFESHVLERMIESRARLGERN